MAQADRIFKLAFRKHFTNHEGNFPLTREVKLGDYGTFTNGYFVRIGNIKDLPFGLTFGADIDPNPTSEEFQSEGSVSVNTYAKGDIGPAGTPLAKATLEVGFSKDEAVFFSAAAVRYNQISNLTTLGQSILDFYNSKKWEKRHFIVTRLIEAERAVVLISGSSNSKISIEADANAPEIDLSNTSLKLSITKSAKVSYKIIAEKCSLGFGLSRVFNPIFAKPEFKGRSNQITFREIDESRSIDKDNLAFGDVLPDLYA